MVRLAGGPGEEPPLVTENFRKFAKYSIRKLQKMEYFRLFNKDTTKPCVRFSRVGRKTQLVGEILQKL